MLLRGGEELSSVCADIVLCDPQTSSQRGERTCMFQAVLLTWVLFFFFPLSLTEAELLLHVKDIKHFLMQDIAFLSGKPTVTWLTHSYLPDEPHIYIHI